jgi:hypothetical protein
MGTITSSQYEKITYHNPKTLFAVEDLTAENARVA